MPLLGLLLSMGLIGCEESSEPDRPTEPSQPKAESLPPGAFALRFVYSQDKQRWLERVIRGWNDSEPTLDDGQRIYVQAQPMESGLITWGLAEGLFEGALVSPTDSSALKLAQRTAQRHPSYDLRMQVMPSLVRSPTVLAIREGSRAEALLRQGTKIGERTSALRNWEELLEVLGQGDWNGSLIQADPSTGGSGLLALRTLMEADVRQSGENRPWLWIERNRYHRDSRRMRVLRPFFDAMAYQGASDMALAEMFAESAVSQQGVEAMVTQEHLVAYLRRGQPDRSAEANAQKDPPNRTSTPKPAESADMQGQSEPATGRGSSVKSKRPTPLAILTIYPRDQAYWCDHPAALVLPGYGQTKLHEAADALVEHLQQTEIQAQAAAVGFRSDDPEAMASFRGKQDGLLSEPPRSQRPEDLIKRSDAIIDLVQRHTALAGRAVRQWTWLALDASTSMSVQRRFDLSRAAAVGWLLSRPKSRDARVAYFNHQLLNDSLEQDNRRQNIQGLRQAFPIGGTDLQQAILAAAVQLRQAADGVDPSRPLRLILISDMPRSAMLEELKRLNRAVNAGPLTGDADEPASPEADRLRDVAPVQFIGLGLDARSQPEDRRPLPQRLEQVEGVRFVTVGPRDLASALLRIDADFALDSPKPTEAPDPGTGSPSGSQSEAPGAKERP